MRRRRASDLRSLLLRGHGAVVDEADEFGEVDEECDRANAGSGSHNLGATPTWRAKDVVGDWPPRTPMGPEPLFGSAGSGDSTKSRSRRGTHANTQRFYPA